MKRNKRITTMAMNHGHVRTAVMYAIGICLFFWLGWHLVNIIYTTVKHKPSEDMDGVIMGFQLITLFITALAIIARRIFNNPLLDKSYAAYLALSPWDADKPLPFGPCHYTLIDVMAVTGMVVFGAYRLWPHLDEKQIAVVQFFLGDYPYLWAITGVYASMILLFIPYFLMGFWLCTSNMIQGQLMIMLMPALVFPHYNLYVTAGVIMLLYCVCLSAVNDKLRRFKWELPYYDADPIKRLRDEVRQSNIILMSTHNMALNPTLENKPLREKLIIVLLACWWTHASYYTTWLVFHMSGGKHFADIVGKMDSTDIHHLRFTEPVTLILCALVIVFVNVNFMSRFITNGPISLFYRPFLGYWFIPRHDAILLTPLLVTAFCLMMTVSFFAQWINVYAYLYLSSFGLVLILHYIPPTWAQWHYTWHHNMELMRPKIEPTKKQTQKRTNMFGV
jgi:hypothetical protein